MAKYVFVYHGGQMPETEEEGARIMGLWQSWFAELGSAIVDGGAPTAMNRTVTGSAVEEGGGANPATGFSVVQAESMDAAVAMAQGCPILEHGTVEVAECMEM